jgi:hypothetical protein
MQQNPISHQSEKCNEGRSPVISYTGEGSVPELRLTAIHSAEQACIINRVFNEIWHPTTSVSTGRRIRRQVRQAEPVIEVDLAANTRAPGQQGWVS